MSTPTSVVVHPLVLLSVVDHYSRVAKNTSHRVLGVLLGQAGDAVNVANSFAVPFEEDPKDSAVWFLDHDYVEAMLAMFKKINAKEKLIGWYHSGPKLRASDMHINQLFKKYTANPVLVIVNVTPTELGIPTDAYYAVEEIHNVPPANPRTELPLQGLSTISPLQSKPKKPRKSASSTSCVISKTPQSARSRRKSLSSCPL